MVPNSNYQLILKDKECQIATNRYNCYGTEKKKKNKNFIPTVLQAAGDERVLPAGLEENRWDCKRAAGFSERMKKRELS